MIITNDNKYAVLLRLKDNDYKQSLGNLLLYKNENHLHSFKTLELPYKDNKRSVSRIPSGRYKCLLRWSPKYGFHYHLKDVEGRTLILIHFGNFKHQTEGCILIGKNFFDINKDGHLDITNSRKSMKILLNLMPNEFTLTIIDLD